MMKQVMRKGYKLFGKYIHRYRPYLKPLADRLKIARLPYTVEEYAAGAVLLSLSTFVFFFIVLTGVFSIIFKYSIVVTLFLSIAFAVLASCLVLGVVIAYPDVVARQRGAEIEVCLVYALMHMATLAGTGVSPLVLFRAISRFGEYGEISRECAFIVRDVEVFGKDLYTAIMDAARYSPSKVWAEILWGIVSTLRSGGNLREYLSEKAHQLMELHEREEMRAIETLDLLTEIFMVLFVLAPVVGAVMVVFMGMVGGNVFGVDARSVLTLLVYFVLPAIGIVFILLADMSKPKEVL